jgi:hypothetical protein
MDRASCFIKSSACGVEPERMENASIGKATIDAMDLYC